MGTPSWRLQDELKVCRRLFSSSMWTWVEVTASSGLQSSNLERYICVPVIKLWIWIWPNDKDGQTSNCCEWTSIVEGELLLMIITMEIRQYCLCWLGSWCGCFCSCHLMNFDIDVEIACVVALTLTLTLLRTLLFMDVDVDVDVDVEKLKRCFAAKLERKGLIRPLP